MSLTRIAADAAGPLKQHAALAPQRKIMGAADLCSQGNSKKWSQRRAFDTVRRDPQMANWLPPAVADRMRAGFRAELVRLKIAA